MRGERMEERMCLGLGMTKTWDTTARRPLDVQKALFGDTGHGRSDPDRLGDCNESGREELIEVEVVEEGEQVPEGMLRPRRKTRWPRSLGGYWRCC